VARQVEAERLLLEGEQLAALELGLQQGRMMPGRGSADLGRLSEIEDRALSPLRVGLRLLAGGERRT
jgi:hypothetical protein